MTPQELYEETKSALEAYLQRAQQVQNDIQKKQQELNKYHTKIIGYQELLEGLKKLDGVSEEENA